MNLSQPTWPLWRRIVFRFFFIFFVFLMAPWTWISSIPKTGFLTEWYNNLIDWSVTKANAHLFHVKEVLVPLGGSGDTSFGWAQLWFFLTASLLGCIIWSVIDHRRKSYVQLNYWLCLFTRYYIALIAFLYGIIKLYAQQMPFPSISQMSTPLGDFLPMRFSWLFIGYSKPYEIFSGVMECFAGLLLLYRRTATLGILMATVIFINVMALNLAYDIPVKIFSMEIVLMCLFLLANEFNRILCFFVLNKPSAACTLYHFKFQKLWMKITRIVFKVLFIVIAVGMTWKQSHEFHQSQVNLPKPKPLEAGVYDVVVYAVNKDTVAMNPLDSIRWADFIIDNHERGSIKTADTGFVKRYQRAYFSYTTDTVGQTITLKKNMFAPNYIAFFHYEPTVNGMILRGKHDNDSLYIELRKSARHFQLAEKQFHWLSEANR